MTKKQFENYVRGLPDDWFSTPTKSRSLAVDAYSKGYNECLYRVKKWLEKSLENELSKELEDQSNFYS